jgi:general secretion pathway protein M
VVNMNREQVISIGAVSLLLLVSVLAVGFSLIARSDALHELTDRRELLARFEAQARSRISSGGRQSPAVAPATAILGAHTQGLAGAELLSYIARLAAGQQATLISSGVELTRENSTDVIHIQATMDIRLKALQTLLFQLETGTPYAFVESLTIVPVSAAAQGGTQDPSLRVTLILRALWRREAA